MSLRYLAAALMVAAPALAHPEDAAINAVYGAIAAGKAANSTDQIAGAFSPDALLIDGRPGPVVMGEAFAARLRDLAARLETDRVKVKADYRIERRAVSGDVAVDSGYMRQAMTRADGAAMTQISRFLVTMKRQADGQWKIIADASVPAKTDAWDGLSAAPGLRFDN